MLQAVRFHVEHESLYRYDVPVQLAEHVLRLTPRPGSVNVQLRRLVVVPEPVSSREEIDGFGNAVTRLAFAGSTAALHVVSQLELETWPPPEPLSPLAPLPHAPPLNLPPSMDDLAAYRSSVFHPEVRAFAASLALQVHYEPLRFLDQLTHTLYSRIDRHVRPSGDARAAHETLALGSGACRDLAVLFMEVCRSQGLAARFVSGYQAQAQTPDGQRHLHAWAEVFLPGSGWHAWDPMHGVRVGDGHVALCAAPQQASTMPVEGGFFFQGASVNSTLDHSVRIGTR